MPAADPSCDEVSEYNRVREIYKLLLPTGLDSRSRPEPVQPGPAPVTLAETPAWKLTRETPRWVRPGEVFAVHLSLARVSAAAPPSVTVAEALKGLTAVSGLDPGNEVNVSLTSGQSVAVKTYLLQAGNTAGTGTITATAVSLRRRRRRSRSRSAPSRPSTARSPSASSKPSSKATLGPTRSLPPIPTFRSPPSPSVVGRRAPDQQYRPFPQRSFVYGNDLLFDLLACLEQRIGQPGTPGPTGPPGPTGDRDRGAEGETRVAPARGPRSCGASGPAGPP